MAAAVPEKRALLDAWRALLAARLDGLARSSGDARDGTRVDGSHRPANRGERAAVTTQGYLAHGLSQRMAALRSTLELLDEVDLSPTDRVRAGALVVIEDEDGDEQSIFIVPGAQGDTVGATTLVSPGAPIARALRGKEEGDEATLETGGRVRAVAVAAVC